MIRPSIRYQCVAYIKDNPGATCADLYAAIPTRSKDSVRSGLKAAIRYGEIVSRGSRSNFFYFADDSAAAAWIKAMPTPQAPRLRIPTPDVLRAFLESFPAGCRSNVIARQFGISHSAVSLLLQKEELAGRLYRCKVAFGQGFLTFTTSELRAAALPGLAVERAAFEAARHERRLARWRAGHAVQAAKRKAAAALLPPKPPKPPKVSAPKPVVARPLKVEYVKHSPAVIDVDTSRAKVTYAPRPLGRWEVPEDFRGAFSMAGVGRDVQTGEAW